MEFPDLVIPIGRTADAERREVTWVAARRNKAHYGAIVDPSGETAAVLVDRLVAGALSKSQAVFLMGLHDGEPVSPTLADRRVRACREFAELAADLDYYRRLAETRADSGAGGAPNLLVIRDAADVFAIDPDGWVAALAVFEQGGIAVVADVDGFEADYFGGSERLRDAFKRGTAVWVHEGAVYENEGGTGPWRAVEL
jgi:hypothetical protein